MAAAHHDADLDGILTIEAELALERIFKPVLDGRDIAKPENLIAGADAQFADIGGRLDAALDGNAYRAVMRLDGTGRIDGILAGKRILHVGDGQAALGQGLGRDIDKDLLRLIAEDRRLFDAGRGQQHVPGLNGELLQLRIGIAVADNGVERDIGIAEFIVEIRTLQACRQILLYIADLLAHLIEGVRHLLAARIALDLDRGDRHAGAGIGLHPVEMRHFLQLALDLVDDLVFHVGDRGARPCGLHHHDAEGEIGIFLLAHIHHPEHAHDDDQAEEEAADARMLDGPARQVEFSRRWRAGSGRMGAPVRA